MELARENVARCGFNKDSGGNTVLVEHHDIFAKDFLRSQKQGVSWEPFDVLTSNPPYIPRKEYNQLSHTVRDFEDPLALLGEYPASLTGEPLAPTTLIDINCVAFAPQKTCPAGGTTTA